MPSVEHESYVKLFREQPALAVRVLQEALGVEVPAYAEARAESAHLDQMVPTQYRADLTVKLVDGEAVLGVVVEVQLSRDADKPYTWPAYLMNLRERWRCPTVLLVVAPEEGLAQWCGRAITTGQRGFVLQPYVAGPGNLPVVMQEEEAREAPEWAMLSVLAHGQGEQGEAMAQAVLPGLVGLDEERSRFYSSLSPPPQGRGHPGTRALLLEGVLDAFKGDKIEAFKALEGGAQRLFEQGAIKDVFETVVQVGGQHVTVRGRVVDGVARVGTAFIP